MKKNTKIYQQMNKVCSLFMYGICAWIWLVGCSPKEAEVLWSEDVDETRLKQNVSEAHMDVGASATEVVGVNDLTEAAPMESDSGDERHELEKIEAQQSMIYIHVCGAVKNPSVVELPEGSRARDALEAAGGFRADASQDYVNLAAEVVDGQQLFFPTIEEVATMKQLGLSQDAWNSSTDNQATGKVNINTADEATLCTLPGIGTSKALAIIDYRQVNGPFSSVEDIMNVSGIKTSAYEKIQDKITVQ